MPEENIGGILVPRFRHDELEKPLWSLFDASWYRRRYRHVMSEEEQKADDYRLEELWEKEGVHRERSPNRYFDEAWYLRRNDTVMRSVKLSGIFESGFQHYMDVGYRHSAPHWLFDSIEYFRSNTDISYRKVLKMGFANGYDYFLRIGDKARQSPNMFFQQDLFMDECLKEDVGFDLERGGFEQYLSLENPQLGLVRTTWYFDPKWYVKRYPDVKEQIDNGQYINPLHHYLSCENAQDFDPNPFFSEAYYLNRYPDVRDAIAQGVFRNGYAHFLASGVHEKRQPCEALDLAAFAQTRDSYQMTPTLQRDNAFVLWIKKEEGRLHLLPEAPEKESYQRVAVSRVASALPAIFRSPLRFPVVTAPELSIIILSDGDYFSVIASLLALHEQGYTACEIIVVSSGSAEEHRRIKQCTEGVTLLYPDQWQPREKLLAYGVQHVTSETIVIMQAGMQPLLGAIQAVQHAMADASIHGGTGQIIGVDGYVVEAGCRLWRDGHITPCGHGKSAYDVDIGHERDVEAVQQGFIFARRDSLRHILPVIERCGLASGFAPLALALRAQGHKLRYIPDILIRDLGTAPVSPDALSQQPVRLKRFFSRLLSQHALPGSGEWQAPRARPVMVMVFSHVPHKEEGEAAKRIFYQIDALQQQGWDIIVVGLRPTKEDRLSIPVDYPPDIECVVGTVDMAEFFQSRRGKFQALWIGGTSVLSELAPILQAEAASLPARGIILDLVSPEGGSLRAMENHLRRLVGNQDDRARLRQEAAEELSAAWICQCIIAGDEAEVQLLNELGYDAVKLLPPVAVKPAWEGDREFSERHGLFFPLPIYRSGDAVHDGFDWFCLQVVPHLNDFLPADVPVWVGTYHNPAINLSFYERFVVLEGLSSPKQSREALMQQCRVMVAPTRAFATQPLEVVEGAAYGLPSVVSAPLMESLHWTDREECFNGGFNDARRFAQAIAELYQNEEFWKHVQTKARERVEKENTLARFREVFADILSLASGAAPMSFDQSLGHEQPLERRFAPAPLQCRPIGGRAHEEKKSGLVSSEEEEESEKQELPTRLGVQLSQ